MRILGLDQSSNCTGYCIIEDGNIIKYGYLKLDKIDKKHEGICYYQEKIRLVKELMINLINEYKVDYIALEDIQKQFNIQTYKGLAHLQGSLINYLYENGYKYTILSPSKWRSILNIKGARQGREVVKAKTIKYIKDNFDIDVVKDDESDAIAIAYATYKKLSAKNNKLEIFERQVK